MEPFVWQENGLFRLAAWEQAYPVVAGMTSRVGPDGGPEPFNLALHVDDDPQRVVARREALCRVLGLPPEAFTCTEQVHGNRIVRVTAQDRGRGRLARETAFPATDGMHTDVPNVLLAAFFADCVPLFFLDPVRRVIGIAHAGWRGTVLDVAGEMVRSLAVHYGTRPRDLRVAIGPSIGPCCYEVDERVAAALRTTFGDDVPAGVLTAKGGAVTGSICAGRTKSCANEQEFCRKTSKSRLCARRVRQAASFPIVRKRGAPGAWPRLWHGPDNRL
jgi:Uncharacterized conserved protein